MALELGEHPCERKEGHRWALIAGILGLSLWPAWASMGLCIGLQKKTKIEPNLGLNDMGLGPNKTLIKTKE